MISKKPALVLVMLMMLGARKESDLVLSGKIDSSKLRPTSTIWLDNGNFSVTAFFSPGEAQYLGDKPGRLALHRLNFENDASLEQVLDFAGKRFASLTTTQIDGKTYVVAAGSNEKHQAEVSWFQFERNQLIPVKSLVLEGPMAESVQIVEDETATGRGGSSTLEITIGNFPNLEAHAATPKKRCKVTLMGDALQTCRILKWVQNENKKGTAVPDPSFQDLPSLALEKIQTWNAQNETGDLKGWSMDPLGKSVRIAYQDSAKDPSQIYLKWFKL